MALLRLASSLGQNQVNVIRHQAVRPDRYLVLITPATHQCDIKTVVSVTKEGLLATIAALRYMQGNTGNDYSGYPCHVSPLKHQIISQKEVPIPYYLKGIRKLSIVSPELPV